MNKKIVYVFNGSDHRPPYINGSIINRDNDEVYTIEKCRSETKLIKVKVKTIEKYADVIIGHHLSAHFHERPIIPFVLIGIPSSSEIKKSIKIPNCSNKIRILHAPSMLKAKGTHYIRKAIGILKAKGYSIEYVEINGRPNTEVLEELSKCDFVIDEIYSDARMAGFATEAAIYKKPAIVCGYADIGHFAHNGKLHKSLIPPVIYDYPDNLTEMIEKLLKNPQSLKRIGIQCNKFVVNNWKNEDVARRFLMAIGNKIPQKYFFDPYELSYVNGFGLSEKEGKNYLRKLIDKFGLNALELNDKPHLLELFSNYCK